MCPRPATACGFIPPQFAVEGAMPTALPRPAEPKPGHAVKLAKLHSLDTTPTLPASGEGALSSLLSLNSLLWRVRSVRAPASGALCTGHSDSVHTSVYGPAVSCARRADHPTRRCQEVRWRRRAAAASNSTGTAEAAKPTYIGSTPPSSAVGTHAPR